MVGMVRRQTNSKIIAKQKMFGYTDGIKSAPQVTECSSETNHITLLSAIAAVLVTVAAHPLFA